MLFLALALLQTAAAPACTVSDASLPAPLAAWRTPAGSFETGAPVTLVATDPATLAPSQKPGKVTSLGFTIVKAGTYRIALDQPGWIDLMRVSDPAPLTSVAHGHGPECSTIRKLVAYDLPAGEYVLKISGLAKPAAKVMLVTGG